MQIYLHISKKSSTFVADLGIVPTITKKSVNIMKKECIFKVWGGSVWLRVLRVEVSSGGPVYYRVMMGRNMLDGVSDFEEKETAVDKAISLARLDVMSDEKGGWL